MTDQQPETDAEKPTLTPEEIKAAAEQYDPDPFTWTRADEERAATTRKALLDEQRRRQALELAVQLWSTREPASGQPAVAARNDARVFEAYLRGDSDGA